MTKSSSIQCVYVTIGSVVITVAVVTIVTVVEINEVSVQCPCNIESVVFIVTIVTKVSILTVTWDTLMIVTMSQCVQCWL